MARPNNLKDRIESTKKNKLRVAVNEFLEQNFDIVKVQRIYDELEPSQKLSFLKDLLGYSIPKYSPIEFETKPNEVGKSTWGEQVLQMETTLKKVI